LRAEDSGANEEARYSVPYGIPPLADSRGLTTMNRIRMTWRGGLAFALVLLANPGVRAADEAPLVGKLETAWTAKVDRARPLPEYPRPQLVRKDWVNLNGPWSYAIRPRGDAQPAAFDGTITVPYPVESALSGVRKPLLPDQKLWYKRTFATPDLGGGKRLLLHFQAVDWEAHVTVNGQEAGRHKGGYDAFTFDITGLVKPAGENELVVDVWDPSDRSWQPRGKQELKAMTDPGGIMYTPCSGIWQTVWLEPVPAATAFEELNLIPDVPAGTLRIVASASDAEDDDVVEAVALAEGKEVVRASRRSRHDIVLPIKDAKLWSPDSPFLYDLKVSIRRGGKVVDEVSSYFGMRSISLGKDAKGFTRILLNGKPYFMAGPLDQGFWPDGIYTAPTDEALRYDIEVTRKLGMNMARKHVKVEPQRWYYWADRLGLLVWQDMPGSGVGRDNRPDHDGVPVSEEAGAQFETEFNRMIVQHRSAPSIVMWIVFNEGWGQHNTADLTKLARELDPSRLVNNASGWTDRKVGDIVDMHNYPGPSSPKAEPTRAAVLGEFGGLGLPITGHTWVEKSWGYQNLTGQKALTRRYVDLWRGVYRLKDEAGLCAAVYTQTTDCETECNGLMTYDRKVIKVDPAQAAAAASGKLPPAPSYESLAPTAKRETVTWRYTTTKPAEGWLEPGFDASGWQEGPAGFGARGTLGAIVRTEWKTPDIWLRREFRLPAKLPVNPVLEMHHDEDAEVYINGVLAAKVGHFTVDYEVFDLAPAAVAALKPGASNVIAIHCRQTSGGQFIDAGLVVERPH
jgi:Glycosyl hydrolases family 2, TIM barrel domain/Glycosyl hydrolases family 2, sugar binding domain/Glycosyl hydrolases family 2